ncbi:MAG TPA: addiction module protein [Chthoniobacterales bacterium]|nr:addiction module protein [Chthoniobacterales bacterium]
MSLTEILAEIPKLSFAERQQLIRRTIELEDDELTTEERAILDRRLEDFRRNPHSGTPAEQLKGEVLQRLKPQ